MDHDYHVSPNGGQKTIEQVTPNGGHCNNGSTDMTKTTTLMLHQMVDIATMDTNNPSQTSAASMDTNHTSNTTLPYEDKWFGEKMVNNACKILTRWT
jgi:hypothetical protein